MPLRFLRNKQTGDSDEELLRFFRELGDMESLGLLYQRYMPLVYGVCLKYIEDRDEAKDEVMNIFEKLVATVRNTEIANFKSWLYAVTRNHCLMVLRSRKSQDDRLISMANDPDFFMENVTTAHPIENDDTLIRRLEECIERLKEDQRRCIQLFYYEGYGYKDIAGELMIEEKKVKSYIQNGKRNLRICLESKPADSQA